jgi:hypothetical protein
MSIINKKTEAKTPGQRFLGFPKERHIHYLALGLTIIKVFFGLH